MKTLTKYRCERCGMEFADRAEAELHEKTCTAKYEYVTVRLAADVTADWSRRGDLQCEFTSYLGDPVLSNQMRVADDTDCVYCDAVNGLAYPTRMVWYMWSTNDAEHIAAARKAVERAAKRYVEAMCEAWSNYKERCDG